jgi:ketosteroid isomerase-like protein
VATVDSTDAEMTKETMDRFYAAIMAWDPDALAEVVDENAELHQPPTLPYGKIYHGRKDMMELWKNTILPMADEGTAYLDNMVIGGQFAIVVAGAKMDGKDTLACEEYQVRDNKIVRIRMFWFDPRPVAEAATRRASG